MEERLCVAAARLGTGTAEELKKGQMEEQRALQARHGFAGGVGVGWWGGVEVWGWGWGWGGWRSFKGHHVDP